MIQKPWVLDAKTLGRIKKLPPAQQPLGLIAYQHHNHNSYKVPCISAFVIYGLFLLLIIAACTNSVLAWVGPCLHAKIKRRMRLLRGHFLEHPLIKRKHASVVAFPFANWLTLQLPLRGEALVVLLISLGNFLPLVAFYNLYVGTNLIYPGAHSRRDQICRHLADRTAVLGVSQLPLLVVMASKRTPLAIMSGFSMNSLMLYHRWIARWFWLHILIHASAYTAIYVRRHRLAEVLEEPYIRWGIVGLSMMSGLVFLSLRALRQRSYEIFVMLHIAMAFFAVLGTYLHIALIKSPKFQLFKVLTEIAAAIWAFDRVVRFAIRIWLSFSSPRLATSSATTPGGSLIKCATAQIHTYGSDSEYTRLRISVPSCKLRLANQKSLFGGIGGGDDIRITIPRLQWVGEHPFTVFGVGTQPDDPAQGYIDLLIKTETGLTRKLARHVDKLGDVELANVRGEEHGVAVLVEGPFGVAPDIQEASDLILVAGGIAITFCWPLFVSAVKARAACKLNSCKLIWIVRKQSTLKLLHESFNELVRELQVEGTLKGCRFSMDIYVTSNGQKVQTSSVSGAASSEDTSSPSCSRSTSSESVQEKEKSGAAQAGSEGVTPSNELTRQVVELPMVPHQRQAGGENEPDALLSGGANGDLIKVDYFGGRPAVLPTALFGHLDGKRLEESKGLTVGLCGPASLCDDVRFEAVNLLKRGIHVDLVEDCFTW